MTEQQTPTEPARRPGLGILKPLLWTLAIGVVAATIVIAAKIFVIDERTEQIAPEQHGSDDWMPGSAHHLFDV